MNFKINSFLYLIPLTLIINGCGLLASDEKDDLEQSNLESVDTLEGVSMTVEEESVSSTGLTVVLENNSDSQVIYSEDLLLEEKRSDSWYQVPVIIEEEYGFQDIGYEVNPGEQDSLNIDWEWLYGDIDEGHYRIVKNVLDLRGTADFDEHQLTAEFEIE